MESVSDWIHFILIFFSLHKFGQSAATGATKAVSDAAKALKIENISREMSNLVGVKFIADDPIQFALALLLTAVQENKYEINSFKTEVLKVLETFKGKIKGQ